MPQRVVRTQPQITRLGPRLESRGFRLGTFFSTDFYELFLRSDLVAASQICTLNHRGLTLANSRFVHLQHDVRPNDMSNWVASMHLDVFVTTAEAAEPVRRIATATDSTGACAGSPQRLGPGQALRETGDRGEEETQ